MTAVAAAAPARPGAALKLTIDDMRLARRWSLIEFCLKRMFPDASVTAVPHRFDPRRTRQLYQISSHGRCYGVDLPTEFIRNYQGNLEWLFSGPGIADAIVSSGPIPLTDATLLALQRRNVS